MLSQLDNIIYPDRCEVLEVIPSQRYVYVIFKNGYTSLTKSKIINKWRTLINEQIRSLDSVDIILRDPEERLVSGVNTYLQYLIKENPQLDEETVLWFIKNYLFLNRHYCLQFSWLLNLARYANATTKFNFLGMDELNSISGFDEKPRGIDPMPSDLRDKLRDISQWEMFHRLDNCLLECVGQSLTFAEVVEYIQKRDPHAYSSVIEKSIKVIEPLNVLRKI